MQNVSFNSLKASVIHNCAILNLILLRVAALAELLLRSSMKEKQGTRRCGL